MRRRAAVFIFSLSSESSSSTKAARAAGEGLKRRSAGEFIEAIRITRIGNRTLDMTKERAVLIYRVTPYNEREREREMEILLG